MVSCVPRDTKCAVVFRTGFGSLRSGKLDDQFIRLDFDARDVGIDEASVVEVLLVFRPR